MKRKQMHVVEVSPDRIRQALEAARPVVPADEFRVLEQVTQAYATVLEVLEQKNISLRRLRRMLFGPTSEKARNVLGATSEAQTGNPEKGTSPKGSPQAGDDAAPPARGHGRNGADDFPGATKVLVEHEQLKSGDECPGCHQSKVYDQADRPGILVRLKGQPPLMATVFYLASLRCNLCGEIFVAEPPPGVGRQKYDESAASMIGLLKYGGGLPFYRLGKLQQSLGIPLPASTQWEIVRDVAPKLEPIWAELVRQAAQGKVLYNDDTNMRILEWMGKRRERTLARAAAEESGEPGNGTPGAERTGIFTSGIVSEVGTKRIALFFTGRRHAGENLAAVLAERARERRPPIQMCDGLARNLPENFRTILSNCLAHGRRKFVDVLENFPRECEHILKQLGQVYRNDAIARERGMSAAERLQFHQAESGSVMQELRSWMEAQIAEKKVEPNSGLGEAIAYMLKRWDALTLFLHKAGAPLDNSVCERSLKKAILHRKNSLFYKTDNGAHVGDVFMTLIHTCELNGVDPFGYLTDLQRHAEEVAAEPEKWLPWNYPRTGSRSPPR